MKKVYVISLAIGLMFFSCKSEPGETETGIVPNYETRKLNSIRKNINLSVLLDLSDRINPEKFPNPAMEYYMRDVGYLTSIAQAFEMHVRSKKSATINDKLQLFIDPEPTDIELNQKLEMLRTHFTRDNAKRNSILKTSLKYDSIAHLIYQKAIDDDHYVGSDTWGFIKNRVEDYCIESEKRNMLIILTDGYIFHKDNKRLEGNKTSYLIPQLINELDLNKSDWKTKYETKNYGFIVPEVDLSNLEVLVVGINGQQNKPYGEDILFKYWKDWLTAMNVKDIQIKLSGLPVNLDAVIKDFILNE